MGIINSSAGIIDDRKAGKLIMGRLQEPYPDMDDTIRRVLKTEAQVVIYHCQALCINDGSDDNSDERNAFIGKQRQDTPKSPSNTVVVSLPNPIICVAERRFSEQRKF